MRNIKVRESNYTRAGKTCPPAMGFSFAAGTTDGEFLTIVQPVASSRTPSPIATLVLVLTCIGHTVPPFAPRDLAFIAVTPVQTLLKVMYSSLKEALSVSLGCGP